MDLLECVQWSDTKMILRMENLPCRVRLRVLGEEQASGCPDSSLLVPEGDSSRKCMRGQGIMILN